MFIYVGKQYKITNITHTGTCGAKGTPRTDGRNPLRLGRTGFIEYLGKDCPLFFHYIEDSDGTDLRGKSLCTSLVVDYKFGSSKKLYVKTLNSLYEFTENTSDNKDKSQ